MLKKMLKNMLEQFENLEGENKRLASRMDGMNTTALSWSAGSAPLSERLTAAATARAGISTPSSPGSPGSPSSGNGSPGPQKGILNLGQYKVTRGKLRLIVGGWTHEVRRATILADLNEVLNAMTPTYRNQLQGPIVLGKRAKYSSFCVNELDIELLWSCRGAFMDAFTKLAGGANGDRWKIFWCSPDRNAVVRKQNRYISEINKLLKLWQ